MRILLVNGDARPVATSGDIVATKLQEHKFHHDCHLAASADQGGQGVK